MRPPDRVRVTTFVAVPPGEAFEIFTREIDRWWGKGPRFRFAGEADGRLFFEESTPRRLVQAFDDGTPPFVVGEVLAWEPGARLLLEWRLANFGPGEVTQVEVRFEPSGEGTRVALEHRGFAALRPDHPVRHGQSGQAFTDRIGLWWAELLGSLRDRAADRSRDPAAAPPGRA
jgi:uncharacterized protein YndB with AHSA1/START domain